MKRVPLGPMALILLAMVLAMGGAVEAHDNITHRVLGLVDSVPWFTAHRPFTMPWPIEATSLRPLSVWLLKGHLTMFSATDAVPIWLLFVHAWVSLSLFALAARAWLRSHGYSWEADAAAACTICLAPTLFQAFYLVELDLLGAAATLTAGALLTQRSLSRTQGVAVAGCLLFAFLLKESTALVQFGFLISAVIWPAHVRHNRQTQRRLMAILGVAGTTWFFLAAPIMRQPKTATGTLDFLSRLPLIEHNLVQLMYLLSPVGAVLIFAASAQAFLPAGHKARTRALPATFGLIILLMAPLGVHYSHYESVYFSPRSYGLLFTFFGLVGLILGTLRGPDRTRIRQLCAPIIAVTGLLTLAGLVAPTAREDMASRIFIALAPLLLAAAWTAAGRLGTESGHRIARGTVGILLASLAWFPMASAFNHLAKWQAKNAVDVAGKAALVAEDLSGGLVMFNNYMEWLDPHALEAAGGGPEVHTTTMLHTPAWLEPLDWSEAHWIYPGGFDLLSMLKRKHPTWIYFLSPRAQMDAGSQVHLEGDLRWTRRELGLFSPVIVGGINRPEDARMTAFRQDLSPLELWAEAEATKIFSSERAFTQIPWQLMEFPRRLLMGVPLIEQHTYLCRLHQVRPLTDEEETPEDADALELDQAPTVPSTANQD